MSKSNNVIASTLPLALAAAACGTYLYTSSKALTKKDRNFLKDTDSEKPEAEQVSDPEVNTSCSSSISSSEESTNESSGEKHPASIPPAETNSSSSVTLQEVNVMMEVENHSTGEKYETTSSTSMVLQEANMADETGDHFNEVSCASPEEPQLSPETPADLTTSSAETQEDAVDPSPKTPADPTTSFPETQETDVEEETEDQPKEITPDPSGKKDETNSFSSVMQEEVLVIEETEDLSKEATFESLEEIHTSSVPPAETSYYSDTSEEGSVIEEAEDLPRAASVLVSTGEITSTEEVAESSSSNSGRAEKFTTHFLWTALIFAFVMVLCDSGYISFNVSAHLPALDLSQPRDFLANVIAKVPETLPMFEVKFVEGYPVIVLRD